MLMQVKKHILENRIEGLRGYLAQSRELDVGDRSRTERELEKLENELSAIPVEGAGSGVLRGPHGA
jgi:hypothetical protein